MATSVATIALGVCLAIGVIWSYFRIQQLEKENDDLHQQVDDLKNELEEMKQKR